MNSKILHALAIAAAAGFFAAPAAGSDEHSKHERSAQCTHEAKGLKGEERDHFIAECVKAKPHKEASNEGHSQQHKMKTCNEEAGRKNLHGDERRAFMSSCLRG